MKAKRYCENSTANLMYVQLVRYYYIRAIAVPHLHCCVLDRKAVREVAARVIAHYVMKAPQNFIDVPDGGRVSVTVNADGLKGYLHRL